MLTSTRHINNDLDGEIENGNCEKGRYGQESCTREKGRYGQEGSGQEGSRQKGSRQKGFGQEGGACKEAHTQRRLHEGNGGERCTGGRDR